MGPELETAPKYAFCELFAFSVKPTKPAAETKEKKRKGWGNSYFSQPLLSIYNTPPLPFPSKVALLLHRWLTLKNRQELDGSHDKLLVDSK
jgi:hypothetical protein